MKKFLLLSIFVCSLFAATKAQTPPLPPVYQFSSFYEVQKVNGVYTPTVQLAVQYGFDQSLVPSLWDLCSFECVGLGHNFTNGGVVINTLPISAGLSVTPSTANGISYGAGVCYDAWNNQFFPVVNLSFSISKIATGLGMDRAEASPARHHGFRVIF